MINKDFVSFGWDQCDFCAPQHWRVAQVYEAGVRTYNKWAAIQCCPTMRFRLYFLPPQCWHFEYDPDNDGLNYLNHDPGGVSTDCTNYVQGLPMGRTSRRGSTAIIMYDHFTLLRWATSSFPLTFSDWDTNMLYADSIPGWAWQWESNNAYQVVQSCPNC